MAPDAGGKEVRLVYGMRGAIPSDRMEQIHSELPYSIALRDVLPCLADPLAVAFVKVSQMQARVRLSYGWHMLNQARIALVEADACTSFYEDFDHNHIEALYRCQYYLDDAALRLHSSCEHLLRAVISYWALAVTEKKKAPERSKDPLLVRVLKAAERSKHSQASVDVAKILRRLRSSKAWKACMKHRNDWVHNLLPAIRGLFPEIVFKAIDYERELPAAALKYVGARKGVKMSVGVGKDISELRETVRNAYGDLFRVYERLAELLASETR